jgi:hypothetical protein
MHSLLHSIPALLNPVLRTPTSRITNFKIHIPIYRCLIYILGEKPIYSASGLVVDHWCVAAVEDMSWHCCVPVVHDGPGNFTWCLAFE